jgi:hypothetical protein
METYSPFVTQTAKDYDMPVYIVQKTYDRYGSTGSFYDELEKIVKERTSNADHYASSIVADLNFK